MKKYTKEQLKIIRKYWKKAKAFEEDYEESIDALNVIMQEMTGLDIEFMWSDGIICGVIDYQEEYPRLDEDELEGS